MKKKLKQFWKECVANDTYPKVNIININNTEDCFTALLKGIGESGFFIETRHQSPNADSCFEECFIPITNIKTIKKNEFDGRFDVLCEFKNTSINNTTFLTPIIFWQSIKK